MKMMFGRGACACWRTPASMHSTAAAITSPVPRPMLMLSPITRPIELLRQRIGTHLELDHFARRALAGFHVEWRTRAHRRPQSFALPPALWVVDSASIHFV